MKKYAALSAIIIVIGAVFVIVFSRVKAHSDHVARLDADISTQIAKADQINAIARTIDGRRSRLLNDGQSLFTKAVQAFQGTDATMGIGAIEFATRQSSEIFSTYEETVHGFRDDVQHDVAQLPHVQRISDAAVLYESTHSESLATVVRKLTLLSDHSNMMATTWREAGTALATNNPLGMMAFHEWDAKASGRRIGLDINNVNDSVRSLTKEINSDADLIRNQARIESTQREHIAKEGIFTQILTP